MILLRLVDGSPQFRHELSFRNLQKVQGCPARSRLDVRPNGAPKLQDLHVFVDDHSRRGISFQYDTVRFMLAIQIKTGLGRFRNPISDGCLARIPVRGKVVVKPVTAPLAGGTAVVPQPLWPF